MLQRAVIGLFVVLMMAAILFSMWMNNGSAKRRMQTSEQAFVQALEDRDYNRMEQESAGVNMNGPLSGPATALLLATNKDDVEELEWLVAHGADVNAPAISQMRPLAYAVELGKFKAARFFVKKGADLEALTKMGERPLTIAAQRDFPAMIEMLLKAGAAVDGRNEKGETALMIAVANGNTADVRVLLNAGANTRAIDDNGHGVAERANGAKRDEILQLLTQAKPR